MRETSSTVRMLKRISPSVNLTLTGEEVAPLVDQLEQEKEKEVVSQRASALLRKLLNLMTKPKLGNLTKKILTAMKTTRTLNKKREKMVDIYK